jgi:uncharacterized protein YukE
MVVSLNVSQERLTHAANQATQVGEGIALNLGRLLNEIELQAPAIQGATGTKFFGKADEISRELKQILDALNTMADNILGAGALYGNTDADAAREIDKVLGGYLPGNHDVITALEG